ncbi:hypothetical protein GP486_003421 [Trichoglossum hirsutum]|uniref:Inositol polyphosphate-related phosphatase domain-containing protein n=1 Tax=Trichoglossum hirsutum TaxID=265104 RepID=A0A9P8RR48_9PEZI|nr:hypothetical protein GP486_003421 [Trichoglossum hirsutum]
MGNSAPEDSMDDSSIKPVSSLRSHFEKMAGPKPPSSTPTSRDGSPGFRSHQESAEDSYTRSASRTSLDLPSRDNSWNSQRGRTMTSDNGQADLHPPSTSTNRNRSPAASVRQRPISMGPLSPPRTPPVVRVDSPKSPPRLMSSANSTPRSAANGPATPLDSSYPTLSPFPGRQFKIPSRSSSPRPEFRTSQVPTQPSSLSYDSKAGFPGVEPSDNEPGGLPGNLKDPQKLYPVDRALAPKGSSVPPRFNRADKPKIPSKPPSISTRPDGANLGPAAPLDDAASPFSTPPSSEDDDSVAVKASGEGVSTRLPATSRQFEPPPVHHSVLERRRQQGSRPGTSGAESVRASDSQKVSSANNFTEHRPGLPPRRAVGTIEKHYPASESTHQPSQNQHHFPPPPKRNVTGNSQGATSSRDLRNQNVDWVHSTASSSSLAPTSETTNGHRSYTDESDDTLLGPDVPRAGLSDYPDSSQANRRMPCFKTDPREIQVKNDTRLFDIFGQYICATGHLTRVWDLLTGELLVSVNHGEVVRVTSLAFKPASNIHDEGSQVWLGTNSGEIQELDIPTQRVIFTKTSAHPRREVIKIHRHANEMWTLDDEGKLHVWPPDDSGSPNLRNTHYSFRVPKGHSCSLVVGHQFWIATGKDIRVFQPSSKSNIPFNILAKPMTQAKLGDITSGSVISRQADRVFFGHTDGKVSIYSRDDYSCLRVVNVSLYKINSLSGVGDYLWVAFNTGMIYVYDTRFKPWKVKKDWHAHDSPVANILLDRSSILKIDRLQVASLGTDNSIRIWDGMLEDDWIEAEMQEHDVDYCEFRELGATVLTWNAGASKPQDIRNDKRDSDFIQHILQNNPPPDILVFGFQELVDLEDKKVTAKSIFKGSKKKESSAQEHMSRQYRDWRDYFTRSIENCMPPDQPYQLLHSASLVGLFTCIFIKASLRKTVRDVRAAEVKRGLKGFHGNKGALIVRFVIDDSSICFVNCHLAAGQSQTVNRNHDIAAILETAALPAESDASVRTGLFVSGGDGSMILDHEICILNGDLNYRIDTIGRDTVVSAVRANDLEKLLKRDQLLLSKRRNPGFRLRAFEESAITFPPTYKYDVGSDNYDSSEKRRAPAWCDRILYRGLGRIKQLNYRRHEIHASDHRPVSGNFRLRVKTIIPEKRARVLERSNQRFEEIKQRTTVEAK